MGVLISELEVSIVDAGIGTTIHSKVLVLQYERNIGRIGGIGVTGERMLKIELALIPC